MEQHIEPKYLTATNVYQYLGISKGFLYKVMKNDPTFPKGLNLTRHKKLYDRAELDNWLRNKSKHD